MRSLSAGPAPHRAASWRASWRTGCCVIRRWQDRRRRSGWRRAHRVAEPATHAQGGAEGLPLLAMVTLLAGMPAVVIVPVCASSRRRKLFAVGSLSRMPLMRLCRNPLVTAWLRSTPAGDGPGVPATGGRDRDRSAAAAVVRIQRAVVVAACNVENLDLRRSGQKNLPQQAHTAVDAQDVKRRAGTAVDVEDRPDRPRRSR